jgi:hypothetical protein
MQGMVEDECSRNAADGTASIQDVPRELTHDEKKAAEAAFRGELFNPSWSDAAAKVYAGIIQARQKRESELVSEAEFDVECSVR